MRMPLSIHVRNVSMKCGRREARGRTHQQDAHAGQCSTADRNHAWAESVEGDAHERRPKVDRKDARVPHDGELALLRCTCVPHRRAPCRRRLLAALVKEVELFQHHRQRIPTEYDAAQKDLAEHAHCKEPVACCTLACLARTDGHHQRAPRLAVAAVSDYTARRTSPRGKRASRSEIGLVFQAVLLAAVST